METLQFKLCCTDTWCTIEGSVSLEEFEKNLLVVLMMSLSSIVNVKVLHVSNQYETFKTVEDAIKDCRAFSCIVELTYDYNTSAPLTVVTGAMIVGSVDDDYSGPQYSIILKGQ